MSFRIFLLAGMLFPAFLLAENEEESPFFISNNLLVKTWNSTITPRSAAETENHFKPFTKKIKDLLSMTHFDSENNLSSEEIDALHYPIGNPSKAKTPFTNSYVEQILHIVPEFEALSNGDNPVISLKPSEINSLHSKSLRKFTAENDFPYEHLSPHDRTVLLHIRTFQSLE